MELPVDYTKLTRQERRQVREQYITRQSGNCHYCKSPLSDKPSAAVLNKAISKNLFPETFFNYPIHLHHNHDTGLTIGAVHAHCNAVLWQYEGE